MENNAQYPIVESFFFSYISSNTVQLISVDETGRGALAGPLCICATSWILSANKTGTPTWLSKAKDSKKMTPLARKKFLQEYLFHTHHTKIHTKNMEATKYKETYGPSFILRTPVISKYLCKIEHIGHMIVIANPRDIDNQGLSYTWRQCVLQSVAQVSQKNLPTIVLTDGVQHLYPAHISIHMSCPKADHIFPTNSTSSILAKVFRDTFMENISDATYDFKTHKGYGTKKHIHTIQTKGLSDLHRKSFIKNISITATSL